MIRKLLSSPGTTALAVFTGIIASLTQIGSQLQQVGWQLGPLAYQVPHSQKFLVWLTIASAACTFVAGIGNSILSLFNKKGTP